MRKIVFFTIPNGCTLHTRERSRSLDRSVLIRDLEQTSIQLNSVHQTKCWQMQLQHRSMNLIKNLYAAALLIFMFIKAVHIILLLLSSSYTSLITLPLCCSSRPSITPQRHQVWGTLRSPEGHPGCKLLKRAFLSHDSHACCIGRASWSSTV